MKAYTATYDMKCLTTTYEVGKTYKIDDAIEICKKGFHFCKVARDVLSHYPYCKSFVLLEVDVTGKIIYKLNKLVTDELTVIRIIPKTEYWELLNIELDENDNLVKEVDIAGGIYFWEYDSNNNLVKEINTNGEIYIAEYDFNNNLVKEIFPSGRTLIYTNGSRIKEILPDGKTLSYGSEKTVKNLLSGQSWFN